MVYHHYPFFNSGNYTLDSEALKKRLYPIFSKYKVDVLFTGHEHISEYHVSPYNSSYVPMDYQVKNCSRSEHIKYSREVNYTQGDYLHQVLIGNSGKGVDELCPDKVTDMAEFVYGNALDYGFSEIEITERQLKVNYIASKKWYGRESDSDDTVVFTTNILRNSN